MTNPGSKEQLEIKKLSLEIGDLELPFYRRPSSWISIVTAFVALFGLLGQRMLQQNELAIKELKIVEQQRDAALTLGKSERRAEEALALTNRAIAERNSALATKQLLTQESIELEKEKGALIAQTEDAQSKLSSLLVSIERLSDLGINEGIVADLRKEVEETSSTLNYCTSKDIALYDEALSMTPDQIQSSRDTHLPWGRPQSTINNRNLVALNQAWWVGEYDLKLKVPLWVAFRLNGKGLKAAKRQDCYRSDPRFSPNQTANNEDFARSGFDRGHMVPRAKMTRSKLAEASVYVYTNITPQRPQTNRRTWLALERLATETALEVGTVYVTSGVIFDHNDDGKPDSQSDDIPTIGASKVAVPSHFYKILTKFIDGELSEPEAYIVRNTDDKPVGSIRDLPNNARISVSKLQQLTGLTLFPGKSDS